MSDQNTNPHIDETENNESQQTQTTNSDSETKIAQLEKELAEIKEIAKKAQYDYINCKMDLDRLQLRVQNEQAEEKVRVLIDTARKFIPFVEELRKSLELIPADRQEDSITKGIQLIYTNMLKTLEKMSITTIDSLGQEPDGHLHEPMGTKPTDDPEQKGKIVQEFSKAYEYNNGETKIVVQTAKVLIGE
jgi:molecular chaperone GrpE